MNSQSKYKTIPQEPSYCHHPRSDSRVIAYHDGYDHYVCAWCAEDYWRENSARLETVNGMLVPAHTD